MSTLRAEGSQTTQSSGVSNTNPVSPETYEHISSLSQEEQLRLPRILTDDSNCIKFVQFAQTHYSENSQTCLILEENTENESMDSNPDEEDDDFPNQPGLPNQGTIYINGNESESYEETISINGRNLSNTNRLMPWRKIRHQPSSMNLNYSQYIEYKKDQIEKMREKIVELTPYFVQVKELQSLCELKCAEVKRLTAENKALLGSKTCAEKELQQVRDIYNLERSSTFNDKITILDDLLISDEITKLECDLDDIKTQYVHSVEQSTSYYNEMNRIEKTNAKFIEINEYLRDELNKSQNKTEEIRKVLNTQNREILNLQTKLLQLELDNEILDSHKNDLFNQLSVLTFYMKSRSYDMRSAKSIKFNMPVMSVSPSQDYAYNEFPSSVVSDNPKTTIFVQHVIDDSYERVRFGRDLNAESQTDDYQSNDEYIKTREIGTQTEDIKMDETLGFWETLLRRFECVPV